MLSARAAFENDVALSGALTGWVDGRGYLVPEDVKISYDGEERHIVLSSRNAVTSIDCGNFIKDGMISDVYYDEGSHTLSILWNSDGGSKTTEINLSGLVDVYKAGYGLKLENGEFSLSADILAAKQDKLSDAQISAIDSVVDERTTYVKYNDDTISSFNIVGEIGNSSISNKENVVEVKIGNTVTSIGNNMFNNYTKLTNVIMPNSVISIGKDAFESRINITSITIPDSVTYIGNGAFFNTGITSITLPNNVTNISAETFT